MASVIARGQKVDHRYGYTSSEQLKQRTPFQKFVHNFKRNWQLHMMIALPLAYIIIFAYLPMYGIQIAFRDYTIEEGITVQVDKIEGVKVFVTAVKETAKPSP